MEETVDDAGNPLEMWIGGAPALSAHALLALIATIVAAGVAFSFVRLDQRVSGRAVLIPRGEARTVKAPAAARVHRLHVHVGDRVRAGQVLLELDGVEARARLGKARAELAQARSDAAQLASGLAALRAVAVTESAGDARMLVHHVDASAAATLVADLVRALDAQDEAATNEMDASAPDGAAQATSGGHATQEFRLRVRALRMELERAQQAQASRTIELETLETSSKFIEQEARAYETLLKDGMVARMDAISKRRALATSQGDVAKARAALRQAVSQRTSAELGLIQLRDEARRKRSLARQAVDTARQLVRQALVAQEARARAQATRIEQLEHDLRLAEQSTQRLSVTAPVSGVVHQTQVLGDGEEIGAGQALAVVIPDGTALQLDARLASRDVGQVRAGSLARVVFDAFPAATALDRIEGTVSYVGVEPGRAAADSGAPFRVLVDIDAERVHTREGSFPLQAGMGATVDVVVKERRILDLVLEPFRGIADASGLGRSTVR